MSDQLNNSPASAEQDGRSQEDLTGRDRLVSNVVFNWAGHFVFIIAGFVMPRMIDRRLGQELLGVWDFAWSLVSYFQFVQAGISTSVNRYVAKYRIAGDIPALNGIVSSAFFVLSISGILFLGLTIALSLLMPKLFGTRLGENVHEAQWVVFFLGASLGIEMAFQAFSGVLTGCHRWGLQNIINSGWRTAIVIGMVIALLMGKGLRILSLIHLMGTVLACAARMISAYRVCEGLRVRLSFVRWLTIRRLYVFGGKTLIPKTGQLLLDQATSVLIMLHLGPVSLALYSRSRSLIFHINVLVRKMAWPLTPTVSSLENAGNKGEIQNLAITSARYSLYLALPMVIVMVVFGGPVMRLWMGPRYGNGLIPAILAAGCLAAMAQVSTLNILAGLNAHGRLGVAHLVACICSVGLNVLVLGHLKWGLVGTALAVTVPLTILNIIYTPHLICSRLGLNVRRYFLSVAVGPALHVLPFAVCIVFARLLFRSEPLTGLILGGVVGIVVLTIVHWRYVLPDQIKVRVFRYLRIILRSIGRL